jgi:N-acetyl-anhydromuramyl-L-alanine amidase AmpD
MNARWVGCAAGNFRTGRPAGFLPSAIVIHRSGGSLAALRARYADPRSQMSAHYVVALDGTVEQCVEEADTAFHAGLVVSPTWPGLRRQVNPNFYTIGIDNEGRPGEVWPAAQIEATAALVAEIAARWSFPTDALHVVAHSSIRASAPCPGASAPLNAILTAAGAVPAEPPRCTDAMELAISAGTHGPQAELPIDRTSLALPSNQYYPVETKKDLLILHFTAGASARSAVETWKSTPEHVATAYVIDRDGSIFEVFSPSCWAYHLGIKGGTVHERRSIGIEIVNVGPLQPANGNGQGLNWWPKEWGQQYCSVDDSGKYVECTYRGKRYFAAFPEPQMQAVSRLTNRLCEQFGIRRQLAPSSRRLEYDQAFFDSYKGIATHVNFRPDKWDIGPAFEWERLGV